MKFIALLFWFTLILIPILGPPAAGASLADAFSPGVQSLLQATLQETPSHISVAGERIHAPSLPEFYRRRLYLPAWSWGGGAFPAAAELVEEIRAAVAEGLVPEHYHLRAIEELLAQLWWRPLGSGQGAAMLAELDLLLTDAFLLLGTHYLSGRIHPATIDPEWHARRRQGDLVQVLENALRAGRVGPALRALLPPQPEYQGLRAALALYRQIAAAGGWTQVAPGAKLQRGDRGPRVQALFSRLTVSGEYSGAGGDLFDGDLEAAVRRFQARHGLEADGVVGRSTLAALNVPASDRVRQLEVNLERWRWLPRDLGQRFVLVNIADSTLTLVEGGESVLGMRVVVGRLQRRTPVFSDQVTYLVLNPYWSVPEIIAVEDILPQVLRDRGYLEKMGMKVLQGWGASTREIEPEKVAWEALGPKKFPYRLRQDPGPLNALGRIKFMLPNEHDIYLHDTPARNLFRKDERTFSSGCIRIEKPMELAEYLLTGTPYENRAALDAALAEERNRTVVLAQPVPVHLLYWTAWVDRKGTVHFRPDIYGRDESLRLALDQPPPAPAERIAAPLRIPRTPGT